MLTGMLGAGSPPSRGLGGVGVYEVRHGLIRTPMATLAAGDKPFATGTAIQVDGGMHIHQY